jgi:hypothetical protein
MPNLDGRMRAPTPFPCGVVMKVALLTVIAGLEWSFCVGTLHREGMPCSDTKGTGYIHG